MKTNKPEKKAWRLIFAQGLLGNYIDGSEQWSFRKYYPGSHEFKKGQIIEGHFLEGFGQVLEFVPGVDFKFEVPFAVRDFGRVLFQYFDRLDDFFDPPQDQGQDRKYGQYGPTQNLALHRANRR